MILWMAPAMRLRIRVGHVVAFTVTSMYPLTTLCEQHPELEIPKGALLAELSELMGAEAGCVAFGAAQFGMRRLDVEPCRNKISWPLRTSARLGIYPPATGSLSPSGEGGPDLRSGAKEGVFGRSGDDPAWLIVLAVGEPRAMIRLG